MVVMCWAVANVASDSSQMWRRLRRGKKYAAVASFINGSLIYGFQPIDEKGASLPRVWV